MVSTENNRVSGANRVRGRQARVSPGRSNFDHDINKTLLCDRRSSNDLSILLSVASCNTVSVEQPFLLGGSTLPPSSTNRAYPFSPNISSSSDTKVCAPYGRSTLTQTCTNFAIHIFHCSLRQTPRQVPLSGLVDSHLPTWSPSPTYYTRQH